MDTHVFKNKIYREEFVIGKNWKELEGPILMKIGNFRENHWLDYTLMKFNIYIFNK